jgi:hypothetical protein
MERQVFIPPAQSPPFISLEKLGNHRAALSTLVNDLHDSSSAEAYCTLGGDVIPGKVIQAICADAKLGLGMWASGIGGKGRQKAVDANDDGALKRKELLKILLEVYMSDECVLLVLDVYIR